MPRANRFYVPGGVWHITHRCHNREFLLKFERDRLRWKYWLFQAVKRYGLCVLNYIVTSNHIHLLVRDTKQQTISRSMQLIAGRVAQEFNQRKVKKGAFWEDRYFATAIDTDQHLFRCFVYIDLNMVRAGKVTHPSLWKASGYNEIQSPPLRYRIVDKEALTELGGFMNYEAFRKQHFEWVESQLRQGRIEREPYWSDAIAVGSENYVESMKSLLSAKIRYRSVVHTCDGTCVIEDTNDLKSNILDENERFKQIINHRG